MRKTKEKRIEVREVVYSQDDDKSFGDIFVYEPENVEEQNLGALFIVGELKDLPRNSSYVVNLIASKVKKEFYANTKRTPEEALEAALGAANQTLGDLADQGNGEYVGKLSMVCGTYKESNFLLSQVGNIKSLLVRGKQIVEIIKEEEGKPANPKRVFNNIASGELEDGDVIIFSTQGLLNIFSLENLCKMAGLMDLDGFAQRLQEEVEQEGTEVVSVLVLEVGGKKVAKLARTKVKMEEKPELPEDEPTPLLEEAPVVGTLEAPETAIAIESAEEPEPISESEEEVPVEVISEESPEEEELAVRIESVEDVAEEEPLRIEAEGGEEADKVSLSDVIREYERIENDSVAESAEREKNIESIIGKKEDSSFEDLDEPSGSKLAGALTGAKAALKGVKLSGVKDSIKKVAVQKKEYRVEGMGGKSGLITRRRILAVAAVAVAFVLVVYPKLMRDRAAQEKADYYQAMLNNAQLKLRSGSAGDLSEAKSLATQVKNEGGEIGSQADAVIGQAQSGLDVMDKIARVSPTTVASFPGTQAQALVEIVGATYVVGGQGAVYKMNASSGNLDSLSAGGQLSSVTMAEDYQNQELLFTDGASFMSYGLKSGTAQALGSSAEPVQSFVTYGRNIYVLVPTQNQIYKYQKTNSALSGKAAWLKSGDVSGAVGMAIDQNVFVLYQDGTVKKFYTGQEVVENGQKFALSQPSEAISSATRIFTLLDQKNLYILEPQKQRVLVFDKTGALIKQFVNEEFATAKDISVDAKETKLKVLLADKVVQIDL